LQPQGDRRDATTAKLLLTPPHAGKTLYPTEYPVAPDFNDVAAEENMSALAPAADAPDASAANESVMQSVSDAITQATRTASDHAARVGRAVADAGPVVLQSASRAAYTSTYFLAYGVVYPVMFVAQALPRQNAVMKGLRAGGQAATDALRARGSI